MGIFDFFKKSQYDDQKQNTEYVDTRFLNWYKRGVHTAYPSWMEYECGITNPRAKEAQMVTCGYLYHTGAVKGVTDCKLTPEGEQYIAEHQEIITAESYRKYDITYNDYTKEKALLGDGAEPEEVLMSIINKRIIEHTKANQFGLLRNDFLAKAQYFEKQKDYKRALLFFIIVQYYDISGLGNNTFSKNDITYAPAVVKALRKYAPYYDPKMLDKLYKLYVPKAATSIDAYAVMLGRIMAGEVD